MLMRSQGLSVKYWILEKPSLALEGRKSMRLNVGGVLTIEWDFMMVY